MRQIPLRKRPNASTPSPFLEVLGRLKWAIFILFIVGLLTNVLQMTSAFYMLQVYDRVLVSRSEATLLTITLLATALIGVYAFLEGCRTAALIGLGRIIDQSIVHRVFEQIFRTAAIRGAEQFSVQPLRDLELVRNFVTARGLTTALDVPWIPVFVFVLYLLHPLFAAFGAVSIAVAFVITFVQASLSTKQLKQSSETNVQAYAFAEASVRNAEAAEAMGMREGVWRRWHARHKAMLDQQDNASSIANNLASVIKFLQLAINGVLVLALGAVLVIEQQITPGVMVVATMVISRALLPTMQAVGLWQQMTMARVAHHRLAEFLASVPPERERMPLPTPTGELVAEGLVLGIPGRDLPILRGVSFMLPAGESMAVIGPSAAGKSTLARGLLGIWSPLAGTARLDGADLSRMQRDQVGPHIGYLPQDVELFEGKISENIARLGEVDPAEVVRAAQDAGLHELILQLPEGYDTMLGPGGAGLSPGQRQRIGLARALYGSPRLVVLDEPNSNLDTEGEAALSRALSGLRQRKVTCVVITHRASILAAVDKILILKAGQVEVFGRREEILPRLTRPAQQPPGRALGTAG